jgi:hypothetical protein
MNRQQDQIGALYEPADDQTARFIAYFGPYLFWGVVISVLGGVLLLS